ncbi:MAG: ABC transporter substrate-binding protein, partial [Planctomycetota bacterium]
NFREGAIGGGGEQAALTKEIKVVDDYTLDFVTKVPEPIYPAFFFRVLLANPKQIKEDPDSVATNPIGTGPYKLVDWQKGQFIKLTANEGYWGPQPNIKDVTVVARAEPMVRASMLKAGEADLIWRLSPEEAQGMPKVKPFSTAETVIVRLNPTNPVLKDERVRQALSYAIDRKALVDALYKGFAIPATQDIPSFVLGYNPDIKAWPYDTEKAKQLLKDAGYNGEELAFYHRASRIPREQEMGEALGGMWKDVGINVSLKVVESAGFMEALRGFQQNPEPYQKGEGMADMTEWPTGAELLDSYQVIYANYHSNGPNSLVRWDAADPELDKKIEAAGQLVDVKAREKAFQAIFAEVAPKMFYIKLFHVQTIHAMSANVEWEPRADDIINFAEMKLKD